MFARMTQIAAQLSNVEGVTKVLLFILALPAVILGTLAASAVALTVVPAIGAVTSLLTAVRTVGKLHQPLVLELPASFTAGAASRYTV